MYGEDIDLSFKVMQAGYNNIYNGKISIIHYKGESTLKDQTYANRFYGAMQIFYNKHFKSNFVFDMLVWFGIKFGSLLLKTPMEMPSNTKQYVFISSENNPAIKGITNLDIHWQT